MMISNDIETTSKAVSDLHCFVQAWEQDKGYVQTHDDDEEENVINVDDTAKFVCPNVFLIPLEHRYTEKNLSFTALKGHDSQVAQLLLSDPSLVVHVVLITKHECGSAASGGYSRKRGYGDDENDEEEDNGITDYTGLHCMEVVMNESKTAITFAKDKKDNVIDLSKLSIDYETSFVSKEAFADYLTPDKEKYREYTGNDGATLEYWYNQAFLLIYREKEKISILMRINIPEAIRILRETMETYERYVLLAKRIPFTMALEPIYQKALLSLCGYPFVFAAMHNDSTTVQTIITAKQEEARQILNTIVKEFPTNSSKSLDGVISYCLQLNDISFAMTFFEQKFTSIVSNRMADTLLDIFRETGKMTSTQQDALQKYLLETLFDNLPTKEKYWDLYLYFMSQFVNEQELHNNAWLLQVWTTILDTFTNFALLKRKKTDTLWTTGDVSLARLVLVYATRMLELNTVYEEVEMEVELEDTDDVNQQEQDVQGAEVIVLQDTQKLDALEKLAISTSSTTMNAITTTAATNNKEDEATCTTTTLQEEEEEEEEELSVVENKMEDLLQVLKTFVTADMYSSKKLLFNILSDASIITLCKKHPMTAEFYTQLITYHINCIESKNLTEPASFSWAFPDAPIFKDQKITEFLQSPQEVMNYAGFSYKTLHLARQFVKEHFSPSLQDTYSATADVYGQGVTIRKTREYYHRQCAQYQEQQQLLTRLYQLQQDFYREYDDEEYDEEYDEEHDDAYDEYEYDEENGDVDDDDVEDAEEDDDEKDDEKDDEGDDEEDDDGGDDEIIAD